MKAFFVEHNKRKINIKTFSFLRQNRRHTYTLEVRLRLTNLSSHAELRIRTQVVEVGGANDAHYANLLAPVLKTVLTAQLNPLTTSHSALNARI